MKKKIAIAVDGSRQSVEAVSYAAMLAQTLPDITFVLIHIQPPISQYAQDEALVSNKARAALEKMVQRHQNAAEGTFDKLCHKMRAVGVDPDCIERKSHVRNIGVAEDLLSTCQTAAYDAVIVGRRGVSGLQGLIMGSVTTNMVEHSQLTPVWVVDGEIASASILLAVDGSQGALRALDHVCFMVSGAQNVRVEMVHIRPKITDFCEITIAPEEVADLAEAIEKGDRRCLDDFSAQAAQTMHNYGLKPGQIPLRTIDGGFSVAQAIISHAASNGFGTIALGRRGSTRSFFTGSVSRKVLQKTSGCAVWIVP